MARHSVDSSHEPVRHVDDHEHDLHETHDTILHHSHAHDTPPPASSPAAAGGRVAKVCALCGENVAGRKRYKDRTGHYYCEDCFPMRGDAPEHDSKPDNATRPLVPSTKKPAAATTTTVTCPDCGGSVDPSLMVQLKGATVCASCAHTRELSAKREAARIAAADEAARQQADRWKMIVTIVLTAIVLLAVFGVIQFMRG